MGSPRRLLIVIAAAAVAVTPFAWHRGAPQTWVIAGAASDVQNAPVATTEPTTTSPSTEPPAEPTSTTVAPTSTSTAPATSPPSHPRIRPTTTTTRSPTVATSLPTTGTEPTTTTTALTCRDSYDARCGQFHWDPEPENQPLEAELSVITPSPRAGQPVEFKIVATDDAYISRHCYDGTFGNIAVTCHSDGPGQAPRYGAWSPPPPQPDRWEGVISHTYEQPGTYTVTLTIRSTHTDDPSLNPYGSSGTATVTLTVGPRAP